MKLNFAPRMVASCGHTEPGTDQKERNMEKQTYKLLRYLKEHSKITQRDAYFYLNIGRLSARVYDLRALGYEIETINKRGGAVYKLVGEPSVTIKAEALDG